MKQSKIIEQLKNGQQEKAFGKLYRYFPKMEMYIRNNSGSKDEALDIFQEALIILFKKVQTLPEDSEIKLDGFLVNTCKLLWSNELRKKKVRQKSGEGALEYLAYQDEIQEQIEKEEKLLQVESIINKIGEKCKNLLLAFYYKKLSMQFIAEEFGFKTIQSAKVQKYKCMEAARNLALDESHSNSF